MEKLELFYPVEPHRVNLPWGVHDEKYRQFGFEAHNGVDLNLLTGQPICAPFDCDVINIGNVPNGSGVFISVLSKQPYIFEDINTPAYVLLDFMHCQKIIAENHASVRLGQILALGDSTGFSTGNHTHMQARRVFIQEVSDALNVSSYRIRENNFIITDTDRNDANGSFDPEPFWNQKYASHLDGGIVKKLEKPAAPQKKNQPFAKPKKSPKKTVKRKKSGT